MDKVVELIKSTFGLLIAGGIIGYLIKYFLDLITLNITYRQEVNKIMIQRLHEYAEKYYMACVGYAYYTSLSIKKFLMKASLM